jgi:hypothetical protein
MARKRKSARRTAELELPDIELPDLGLEDGPEDLPAPADFESDVALDEALDGEIEAEEDPHPLRWPTSRLEMPARLVARRTFSQRGRLLLAGTGWIAGGLVLLAIAAALAWLRPQAALASRWILAGHLAVAALPAGWGLWCLHRGLRPGLVRTVLDADGVRQRIFGLGPSMRWADVGRIELGDDEIRLRAGRGEITIHAARNFVQRNEPVLSRWWRQALTGSGRRLVLQLRSPGRRPATWLALASALAAASWLIAAVALGSALGWSAIYAAAGTGAAATVCLLAAGRLAWQRVELTTRTVKVRGGRGRRRLAWEGIGLVSLNKLMLDFKIVRGEIELVTVAGRRLAFPVDGEAYEDLSALVVRKCPRAFVIEHDIAQAAPPLQGGIDNSRDRMVRLCRRHAIRRRSSGILAAGAGALAMLGVVLAVQMARPWLAAGGMVAVAVAGWAALQDFARAARASRTATGLGQLDAETWADPSVRPEDDKFFDLVA